MSIDNEIGNGKRLQQDPKTNIKIYKTTTRKMAEFRGSNNLPLNDWKNTLQNYFEEKM